MSLPQLNDLGASFRRLPVIAAHAENHSQAKARSHFSSDPSLGLLPRHALLAYPGAVISS